MRGGEREKERAAAAAAGIDAPYITFGWASRPLFSMQRHFDMEKPKRCSSLYHSHLIYHSMILR